jgi:hypothetical protein
MAMLEGGFEEGDTVRVDIAAEGDRLTFARVGEKSAPREAPAPAREEGPADVETPVG